MLAQATEHATNKRAERVLPTPFPALTKPITGGSKMAVPAVCSIDGCGKAVRARGWCVNHYALWQRNGSPAIIKGAVKTCSVEGCEKSKKGRGWCAMHYWRFKHHGDPHALAIKPELAANCAVTDCHAAPVKGRKGMCDRHYQMSYRRGTVEGVMARRGEPERWLRDHVGHSQDDCLIWPFARHTDGSAAISSRYSRQASRAMCIMAHGKPPSASHQAAHGCGKGHLGCVNPRHLRWATPLENTHDKFKHGTMMRGEQHPVAKLDEMRVRAIRHLSCSFTVPDLAEMFAVHAWTVKDIVDRKTWSWLE